jgi:hypothetical protein
MVNLINNDDPNVTVIIEVYRGVYNKSFDTMSSEVVLCPKNALRQ